MEYRIHPKVRACIEIRFTSNIFSLLPFKSSRLKYEPWQGKYRKSTLNFNFIWLCFAFKIETWKKDE